MSALPSPSSTPLHARQGRATPAAPKAPVKGDNTGCVPLFTLEPEINAAMREAFAHGERQGAQRTERTAYRSGFRWGLLSGLAIACLSTAAALNLGLAIAQGWAP